MDATEEAILNSLFMAETTTGFRGHVRHAVPLAALPRRQARGPHPRHGSAPATGE